MQLSRRSFFAGLLAAPAVVHASSLMAIVGERTPIAAFMPTRFELAVMLGGEWRTVSRIVDVTPAELASAAPPDLFALMTKAMVRAPFAALRHPGTRFLVDPVVRQHLDFQAMRGGNLLLGTAHQEEGFRTVFRHIPIEVAA